jgi:hypothetical protein
MTEGLLITLRSFQEVEEFLKAANQAVAVLHITTRSAKLISCIVQLRSDQVLTQQGYFYITTESNTEQLHIGQVLGVYCDSNIAVKARRGQRFKFELM